MNGTCGWYLWAGEYRSDPDFFQPQHAEHVYSSRREIVGYLGLPPGWGFVVAPGYEDVWRGDPPFSVVALTWADTDGGGTRRGQRRRTVGGTVSDYEPKKISERYYDEVFRRRNLDAIDELLAEDFVEHNPGFGQAPDRQGAKQIIGEVLAAFPDLELEVERAISEGDTVAAALRFTGTHQGEMAGIPATGRRVSVAVTELTRFRDGKCIERWGVVDRANLVAQLGMSPGGGF